MVEFALVLPMLVLMMLGVIELGRYAYIAVLVGNAARAGASYGSLSLSRSSDIGGITTAATNDFKNNGQTGLSVTATTSCGCDSSGTITSANCSPLVNIFAGTCPGGGHWIVNVVVTASGSFTALFNYPGIPSPLNVSETATLRVENQ